MFGDLELPTFTVEMITTRHWLRGEFQPRGDIIIYMNDRRHTFFRLDEAEMKPLTTAAQVRGFRQPMMSVSRRQLVAVSVLDDEIMEHVQLMQAKRPFIFYTEWFAIHGNLHINPDAPDEDVFDENHDFYAVSDASVFPIQAARQQPARRVKLLSLHKNAVHAHHPHKSGE